MKKVIFVVVVLVVLIVSNIYNQDNHDNDENKDNFFQPLKNTTMKKSSFQDLDIYKSALELFLTIHPTSLKLPKFEMYELGSQLRRSADGVISNIVEGYGRRRYKAEFVRFLIFSHAGCLETQNHLEKLRVLYPDYQNVFEQLQDRYISLGIKIHNFISYVENNWKV